MIPKERGAVPMDAATRAGLIDLMARVLVAVFQTLLLFSGSGMAFGGWLAGAIYDYTGFYAVAFAIGILFNLVHLALIGSLVWRHRLRTSVGPAYAAE